MARLTATVNSNITWSILDTGVYANNRNYIDNSACRYAESYVTGTGATAANTALLATHQFSTPNTTKNYSLFVFDTRTIGGDTIYTNLSGARIHAFMFQNTSTGVNSTLLLAFSGSTAFKSFLQSTGNVVFEVEPNDFVHFGQKDPGYLVDTNNASFAVINKGGTGLNTKYEIGILAKV